MGRMRPRRRLGAAESSVQSNWGSLGVWISGLFGPSAPSALPANPYSTLSTQGTGFSVAEQNQQAQAAIGAGADPGIVATLMALGATPGQLTLVAKGQWNPNEPGSPNDSAMQALDYLTGNSPLPGGAVNTSANYPTVDVEEQGFGPLNPTGVANAAQSIDALNAAAAAPADALDWFSDNWPWVAGGAILVYVFVKKA